MIAYTYRPIKPIEDAVCKLLSVQVKCTMLSCSLNPTDVQNRM